MPATIIVKTNSTLKKKARLFDGTSYSGNVSHWVVIRPDCMAAASGPAFCGVPPASAAPITKAFYTELFGGPRSAIH